MLAQMARLAAVEGQRAPALDDSQRAAQLYGAAEALRVAIGTPVPPHHRTVYHAAALAATRARLGEEAFDAAWNGGRTLTLDQAIELAMTAPHHSLAPVSDAGDTPVGAARGSRDTSAELADLSAREREVLRLVAEGLTDKQVAERLIVSQRTVQAHLRSIYSKLDVTTRTAAVRYAVDHQLL
jgi:DNA-binding NarL/FixJ family response regulator